MKKIKYDIIVYIGTVLLLLLISYFLTSLTRDEIWNYGFSYQMAHGKIPYRDFNMVIGPFYNYLIALFLVPLKNYLFLFSIINSLLFALLLLPISKKLESSYFYFLLFLGILPIPFTYNTFLSFLLILILILEESKIKNKTIFTGIILSLIFMTKQNIGILLFLLFFFYGKEKKKKFFSFSIPCFIFFGFLFYHKIFFHYIDFCYLGLGSFLDNFSIQLPFLLIEVLILWFLGRKYLRTKDLKILYLIGFQSIAFPIIDSNHVLIGGIPVLYYFFVTCKKKEYLKIGKQLLMVSFIVVFLKDLPFSYTTIDSFIKYRRTNPGFDSYFSNITNYVKQKEQEYHVYLLMSNAYLIRLELLEFPNHYDLINRGNLGTNQEKYLNQIQKNCQNQKCLFILDHDYFRKKQRLQNDPIFKDYIVNNYIYLETLASKDQVYTNEK